MKRINRAIVISCICIQTVFGVIGVRAVYNEITATESDANIEIDNFRYDFQNKIVNIDGVTYVPLREMAEILNGEVEWHQYGSTIAIYTSDLYISDISSSGIAYHYYKNPIKFDKNQIIAEGFKYIDNYDKLVFAENCNDLIGGLNKVGNDDTSNELYPSDLGLWYNVYEDIYNNLWIVYAQHKTGSMICDVDELYTIDKSSGKVEKYTSIGTSNQFHRFLERNN